MVKINIPIERVAGAVSTIKDKGKGAVEGAISGARDSGNGSSNGGSPALGAMGSSNNIKKEDDKSKRMSDGKPLLSEKENARVEERLDPDEKVVMSIRQGRATGMRVVTPAAIFVTEHRVVMRKPKRMGLGEDLEEYRYDDISNVRFEKGLTSSKIILDIPGGVQTFKGKDDYYEKGAIGGLSKKDAEPVYQYIRQRIKEVKEDNKKVEIVGTPAAAPTADPMTALKTRFVNGEITAEQFAEMKKILED